MSDQGERGVRWTEMSESDTGRGPGEPQAGSGTDAPQGAVPEAPGRTEFTEPPPLAPHDIWGKVETPAAAPEPPPAPAWPAPAEPARAEPVAEEPVAAGPEPAEPEPAAPGPAEAGFAEAGFAEGGFAEAGQAPGEPVAAEDVKVAPVPGDDSPQWEGSLFDEGDGDPRYQPAVPTGVGGPARPGKPSSGNWQMPDWMADEEAADAKLGGSPSAARGELDGGGRTRLVLVGGVGLLVVALVAAGGVYLLKGRGGDGEPKRGEGTPGGTASAQPPQQQPQDLQEARVKLPPDRPLRTFAGRPSRVLGQVTDARSGLSWPRFAAPWQLPTKQNKLGTPGWSGQQVLVTERHPGRLWYGQFLTGTLAPSLRSSYKGPGSVKNVTGMAAKGFEGQYYGFPHRTAPLASAPLTVSGHKGWLIASYLTYKRTGVRATGEIVATAVIDTGRPAPAVVFASLPNTHKKVWPDLNQFVKRLKVAA
ncbi:hypothetical protein AGRA3207_002851 [Actinomadura graeca]|uniref:Uncharacterized protein n=1 Tax=Actinomadura graeca TaxID=2750812 RepID=A0ABX8QT15_9ACTN|nr:hypothetical protein [Actinomadura graeca]QXJ21935.1 hypothetical protein AGRA3207_002851 [Actinomadura graeca]